MPLNVMIDTLDDIKGYLPYFKAAFPEDPKPVNKENVGKAIATYERTVVSAEAPFDKWIKGDESAISPLLKRYVKMHRSKKAMDYLLKIRKWVQVILSIL